MKRRIFLQLLGAGSLTATLPLIVGEAYVAPVLGTIEK